MSATSSPLRADGQNGTIEFDGATVTIVRSGLKGKLSGPRQVPVGKILRVHFKKPQGLWSGTIRFAVPGEIAQEITQDKNGIQFKTKHSDGLAAIRDAVEAVLSQRDESETTRLEQAATSARAADRVAERAAGAKPAKYDDHQATGSEYTVGGMIAKVRKPIAGTTALFENGADTKRSTLTRIGAGAVLAGPLGAVGGALLRKNTSKCYVTVTFADGDSVIVEGPAKDEKQLREFAAGVNRLGSLA